MYFIGIDPGKKGGVSILTTTEILKTNIITSVEMPIGYDKDIDIVELSMTIQNKCNNKKIFCCIEKSQSMPGQGVKSVFAYGKGYGQLIAMLKLLTIPFQEISPMKWKREFNLIKKDKKQSAIAAQQLFPSQVFTTPRNRLMDGKAESLLIAEYARRIYK